MSDCKDLHRFIMGEFHVDGWKSEWRKAMEADFAVRGVSGDSRPVEKKRSIKLTPPVFRPDSAPKEKRKRKPQPKWIPSKFCLTCQKPLRDVNESGYCGEHYKRAAYDAKNGTAPKCTECGLAINRKNSLGKCRKHAFKYHERNRRQRLKEAA